MQPDDWPRWAFGDVWRRFVLTGPLTPVLASWMARDHPDQVRLQAYLDALTAALGSLPAGADLALHLEVTVIHHSCYSTMISRTT
jgi:hypothetical protein